MEQSNKANFSNLFEEKSLFQIFSLAPTFFSNRFNGVLTVVVGCLLTGFALVHICSPTVREAIRIPFADTFSMWANVGAALAGTILGFLIAGFVIVCTILRPDTILALQKMKNEDYQITELKLLLVVFADIFVQYLMLLFWSILVIVVGGKSGPAAMLGILLARAHWMIPFCLLHMVFVAWGTWSVMLVLGLKSFVYNLYQSLLLALVDAADSFQRGATAAAAGTLPPSG